jgi:hypothetical protein
MSGKRRKNKVFQFAQALGDQVGATKFCSEGKQTPTPHLLL